METLRKMAGGGKGQAEFNYQGIRHS